MISRFGALAALNRPQRAHLRGCLTACIGRVGGDEIGERVDDAIGFACTHHTAIVRDELVELEAWLRVTNGRGHGVGHGAAGSVKDTLKRAQECVLASSWLPIIC